MQQSSSKSAAKWLFATVALVVVAALLAYGAIKAFPDLSPFSSTAESRNTQIINSITREEQVVLLSLGIQGISEQTERGSFLGMDIPGSGRATFVQYAFHAKLGIDGRDVRITQTDEANFVVSIPEFIFIGHDKESFETVVENNGVLSWTTPEIDTVEMINEILDDEAQDQYVDSNMEVLEDQARVFYSAIVTSIDPSIALTFEFRE